MDIEELIERLKIHLQSYAAYNNPDLARVLEDAANALEKLQSERDRYKSHVDRLLLLPDCNTCDSQDRCAYCPDIGAFTRINCPLWHGKKKG